MRGPVGDAQRRRDGNGEVVAARAPEVRSLEPDLERCDAEGLARPWTHASGKGRVVGELHHLAVAGLPVHAHPQKGEIAERAGELDEQKIRAQRLLWRREGTQGPWRNEAEQSAGEHILARGRQTGGRPHSGQPVNVGGGLVIERKISSLKSLASQGAQDGGVGHRILVCGQEGTEQPSVPQRSRRSSGDSGSAEKAGRSTDCARSP